MPVILNVNGLSYPYPLTDEEFWGAIATNWAVAISQESFYKSTGNFFLTKDANFGPTFGLRVAYIAGRSANVAQIGLVRLANTQLISWRTAANTGNISLGIDGNDTLIYNNLPVVSLNAYPILKDTATGIISMDTLLPANGGTGQIAYSNGDLLIGNSVSGGLDRANLTQGSGIIITNTAGTITIDAAVGRTFYLVRTQTSDIASYNVAASTPSANAEVNTSAIFTGTSFSLVSVFATPAGEPDVSLLAPGTYGRHFYATTDGVNSEAQLRVELYKRASNNLETLLRSDDSPTFNSASAAAMLLNWNVSDANSYLLDVTDRLIWKVYARRVSGGSGSVRVTIYYEGSQRASYFPTTIMSFASDGFARAQANAAFDKANAAVQTGFVTVNVAGQNNIVAESNTDTLTLIAGTGVAIVTDSSNDTIEISVTGTATSIDPYARTKANGAVQTGFVTVNVAGQSDVVATSNVDTLILAGGVGMVLTTNAASKTITFQGGAYGNGTNRIFFENDHNVTASYAISAGRSATSLGPITINAFVMVTIPSGSRWFIF